MTVVTARGCGPCRFCRKGDGRKFITRRIRLEEMADGLGGYKEGKDLKVVVEPWK